MKHNKKRNVGIVYELLLKHISTKLLEGNKKEAKIATRLIEKHFKKGTELYKSALLKDINYKIADKEFYYRSISDYRELGLVQLSLNEWRKEDRDVKRLVDLETRLGELMLRQKNKVNEQIYNASHGDRLVLKIMTEKFNRRYGEELTSDQKKIIEVRKKITNLSSKDINDQSVVKFLTLTKMISEIKKEL